jgi:hypothetical protein
LKKSRPKQKLHKDTEGGDAVLLIRKENRLLSYGVAGFSVSGDLISPANA